MNDYYTFIVSSTINTEHGEFDNETRFNQTIETLNSIKDKVPNSKILFIDNSSEPLSLEQIETVKAKVDIFEIVKHNLVTEMFNKKCSKGGGEIYMMYEAMKLLRQYDMIGKRVFKLAGRYKLEKDFDISEYNGLEGKYTFKINTWDVSKDNWLTIERIIYFETRLWSFCKSLFDEYETLIPIIFNYMMTVDHNLEKSYHRLFEHNKVVEFDNVHVEGFSADTGIIKIE